MSVEAVLLPLPPHGPPSSQPIGVGFSYGKIVNNSRDAAYDVYDFMQKFYSVFPQYAMYGLRSSYGCLLK